MTLHYVKDRKAIDENSPDSEFLLRDVNAAVNKNLSRVIRTKVIDAMMTKARNGWLPTNHAPLGYKHERQGKGTVIVVDPDRQKVRQVRREFELRAFNHLSLREIRRQILGEGYVSPEKAASYHISSIDKRLKSPFYRGSFFFRGVEYQGKHELIIPPAMIAAVDAKSGARGKNRAVSGVFGGGWLKCAECACHVVHDPKTKHLKVTGETRYFSYYRCSNGRGAHEKRVHVREESLWLQFGVALDSLALEEELAVRIAEALNEAHSRGKDARRREAEGHAARLLALEKREDELYQDFRREILDEPTYRRHVEKVREDRRAVTRAMHEANDAIDDAVLETAQSTIELAKMARTLWSTRNAEEKRTFLDLILSNPRLSGRKVQYDLLKPFEALRGMREGGEMRRLADVFLTACAQMAA
jgi:hypothetical protein